jgi:multicomponent Na+:H+ antiporter subunit E
VVFGAVWAVFAGPYPVSWIIGVPAVLASAWVSTRLSEPGPRGLSLWGLVRFLPFFVWESLKGGIDVALRVMRPRMDIDPGYRSYRIGLVQPAARVLFLDGVSLLPGTLSADIEGDMLIVHALDQSTDHAPELRRLERRVAALFGDPGGKATHG